MTQRYYLAYGSDLSLMQMHRRCPGARVVGTSVLLDHRLAFRGCGAGARLTADLKAGETVPVGVWAVTQAQEKRLDREHGGRWEKRLLRLTIRERDTGRVRRVDAFYYTMGEGLPLEVPFVSYVRLCLAGYDDFGFDEKTLVEAYHRCLKNGRQAAVSAERELNSGTKCDRID